METVFIFLNSFDLLVKKERKKKATEAPKEKDREQVGVNS